MLIEYQIADDRWIRYNTGGSPPTLYDIENIAMMYAETMPEQLPTHCFMHVAVYSMFLQQMGQNAMISNSAYQGQLITHIMTGCGPLIVKPMPWAWDKFKLLIGTERDYDRYNVDKVFEEVVMKDFDVAE